MASVLAILANGFEEIEALAPVDLLRRAGVEVTVASLDADIHVKGRCGIVIQAETSLAACIGKTYDCVFLPGGPGTRLLRGDGRVIELCRRQAAHKGWLAAICAAPTVLLDAGLLTGRRYTAHHSVADELAEILSSERVVVDGRIITSRGAGTSIDLGLSLIEHLVGANKAREVGASIAY